MDIQRTKRAAKVNARPKDRPLTGAIDQFYQGLDDKVYVSFSGGKDNIVLYWLARKIYQNIKAVSAIREMSIPTLYDL